MSIEFLVDGELYTSLYIDVSTQKTRGVHNVVLILARRLRRRTNIKTTLSERLLGRDRVRLITRQDPLLLVTLISADIIGWRKLAPLTLDVGPTDSVWWDSAKANLASRSNV